MYYSKRSLIVNSQNSLMLTKAQAVGSSKKNILKYEINFGRSIFGVEAFV
jgi:hypothetical protein